MLRIATLGIFLILSACQTTKMTPDQVAENWAGEWTGTFSHGCNGTFVITKVTTSNANVVYKWRGNCGGSSSGEIIDSNAQLAGQNLRVNLGGGYKINADIMPIC